MEAAGSGLRQVVEIDAARQPKQFERLGQKRWREFPQFAGTLDLGLPLMPHSSLWLRGASGYSPGIGRIPTTLMRP